MIAGVAAIVSSAGVVVEISGIQTLRVWWVTAGVEAAGFFGSVGVGWLVMALGAVRKTAGLEALEETLDSFAVGRA